MEIKQASLVFPNGFEALRGIDWSLPQGSRVALVGKSGCGKTTLLRVIAGLQDLSAGRRLPSAVGESVAYVFQQPALLPWRNVLDNVCLPLSLGAPRGDKAHHVYAAREVLRQVELDGNEGLYPRELSGGMQMRVSIARALITNPTLLLLDEPFAALDDILRAQLGRLVTRLWEKRGFSMVMVTHNIGEAICFSDRVDVMRSGRVQQQFPNRVSKQNVADIRRTACFGDFYGEITDALTAEQGAFHEDSIGVGQ